MQSYWHSKGRLAVLFSVALALGCTGAGPRVSQFASVDSVKEAGSRVSRLLIRPSRNSPGQRSPYFREGRSTVYCSFDVNGLAANTQVTVHWRVGNREIARNDLVTTRGTRTMAADLSSDAPLPTGTYEVEVRVGQSSAARTTFRILADTNQPPAEAEPPQGTPDDGPSVAALTLTTDDECIPSELRRRSIISFPRSTETLAFCFDFAGLEQGSALQVRWLRGTGPRAERLANTTYSPDGDGDLSANFTHNGPIPPGQYAVVVILDGRELNRLRFLIRR